jgi:hypothetical protein
LRENLLNQRLDAMLYDEVYDASPNSLTTVTYVDGELASTVRVHVITDKEGVSPARDVFPDVVTPYLRAQRVIIDPSRLAARADMARRFPELPYFALRPPWMAAHYFNADYIVLCSASGHEAYYRRVYRFHTWSGLRSYPMVTAKVVCMGWISPRRWSASSPGTRASAQLRPNAKHFSVSSCCRSGDVRPRKGQSRRGLTCSRRMHDGANFGR